MSEIYIETADGALNIEKTVAVSTTARLHMGFFDLNGALGRCFGSIGLSLDQPVTEVCAAESEEITTEGPDSERALKIAVSICKLLNLEKGVHIQLRSSIPKHSGLGSGTQLSLAIGYSICKLFNLNTSLEELAVITDRGARSGIGVGTFQLGGVVVDGGRGASTILPPIISRLDFPEEWRIVLIFDHSHTGVHGEQEKQAFRSLPVFPSEVSSDLCRAILMQALPALIEKDLKLFGSAITLLQEKTGDYFSQVQGGRYASSKVGLVIEWLRKQGCFCYGQSSWGPTGFAIFADENEAGHAMNTLRVHFEHVHSLEFKLVKARNKGAIVNIIN